MREADENLKQLEQAFTLYCNQLRHFERVPLATSKNDASPELKELIGKLLSELIVYIELNSASPIYVRQVISHAVNGIGHPLDTAIWQEYFLGEITIGDIALQTNYSRQSVSRRIKSFPKRIAYQLWMKNHELANPRKILPPAKTIWQQQHEIVSQKFCLTNKETDVILTFVRLGNQRRKGIALELGISKNTLKTHLRSILKKMRVLTVGEAVQKVRIAIWAGEADDKQN